MRQGALTSFLLSVGRAGHGEHKFCLSVLQIRVYSQTWEHKICLFKTHVFVCILVNIHRYDHKKKKKKKSRKLGRRKDLEKHLNSYCSEIITKDNTEI